MWQMPLPNSMLPASACIATSEGIDSSTPMAGR